MSPVPVSASATRKLAARKSNNPDGDHIDSNINNEKQSPKSTMATKETSDLGESHAPRQESIDAFNAIKHELKKQLVHLRHDHDKHEPDNFAAARGVSDHDLVSFSQDDFVLVRVATTAYGIILFGKLRLPALPGAYVHFRAFSEGPDQDALFHSFYTEEKEGEDGHKTFRTLFTEDEPLDWFDA